MRICTLLLLFASPALLCAQESDAEKLFRSFEKKLKDAKAYRFEVEIDRTIAGSNLTHKGEIVVTADNKFKAVLEGKVYAKDETEAKPISGTIISDGKRRVEKFTIAGESNSNDAAVPAQWTTYFTGYLAFSGAHHGLLDEKTPHPDRAPDKFKLAGFQLGAKDKIGGRNAQLVEFTFDQPITGVTFKTKIWFDAETEFPLKRVVEAPGFRVVEQYSKWQWEPKLNSDEFALPK
jgi:outer membrane lipoprotein-sorting protein